jgi:hypothetical protein
LALEQCFAAPCLSRAGGRAARSCSTGIRPSNWRGLGVLHACHRRDPRRPARGCRLGPTKLGRALAPVEHNKFAVAPSLDARRQSACTGGVYRRHVRRPARAGDTCGYLEVGVQCVDCIRHCRGCDGSRDSRVDTAVWRQPSSRVALCMALWCRSFNGRPCRIAHGGAPGSGAREISRTFPRFPLSTLVRCRCARRLPSAVLG